MRIPEDKGLNGIVFECIQKALAALGDSAASSILYQIEKKYHLPREEFAPRPLDFIKYLRQFLGESGSVVIERLIVREMISAFNLRLSASDATFERALEEARKNFLAS